MARALAVVALLGASAVAYAQSDRTAAGVGAPAPSVNLPVAAGGAALATTRSSAGGLRLTVASAVNARLDVFAGGAPGATLVEGLATFGARYRLTSEARAGVATFVGTRYSAAGHEGRPELALSLAAQKHLGALLVCGSVELARELAEDQRDAALALAALRAISRRVALGLAGQATIDLDRGRADGGEVRWEASAGPAASVRLGAAALLVHGGTLAVATPVATRAGGFALASFAGRF